MRALIVYESVFGNGRAIAEAVADGLSTTELPSVNAVDLAAADRAPTVIDRRFNLVVVGAPNHQFGLPTPRSRRDAAARDAAALVPSQGVREWLDLVRLDPPTARAAVWDTRMVRPGFLQTVDHASSTIRTRLRRAGFRMLAPPRHFLVEDMAGPLVDGELDRARAWGVDLAERMTPLVAPTV